MSHPSQIRLCIVGQGRDLTSIAPIVERPCNPVIQPFKKGGRLLGFDAHGLTMHSVVIKFPAIGVPFSNTDRHITNL